MEHRQWYIGAVNGVVICINGRNESSYSGEIFHHYSEKPEPFTDLSQMTLRMEHLFDELNYPFPGTTDRNFITRGKEYRPQQERTIDMTDEELLQKHGDIGTFIIRVQHRQNSTWQGRITWMEEDKTVKFRSVWEMIKLMENAMDTVSVSEEGEEPSWDE